MSLPTILLTTTCDIYRPFNSTDLLASNVPCRLVAEFGRGRSWSLGPLMWTHRMDLGDTVDIQDGCSRTLDSNSLNYADGDEVRIPSGGSARYVVVWVEMVNLGTSRAYQRVYLMRHEAS